MDGIKTAFAFFVRAVGFGIGALLVGAAAVWVFNVRADNAHQAALDAATRQDAAKTVTAPYVAVGVPIVKFENGTTVATAWVLDRRTGSIAACTTDLNATYMTVECTKDQDGNVIND